MKIDVPDNSTVTEVEDAATHEVIGLDVSWPNKCELVKSAELVCEA